jgi:hypothetical protein
MPVAKQHLFSQNLPQGGDNCITLFNDYKNFTVFSKNFLDDQTKRDGKRHNFNNTTD